LDSFRSCLECLKSNKWPQKFQHFARKDPTSIFLCLFGLKLVMCVACDFFKYKLLKMSLKKKKKYKTSRRGSATPFNQLKVVSITFIWPNHHKPPQAPWPNGGSQATPKPFGGSFGHLHLVTWGDRTTQPSQLGVAWSPPILFWFFGSLFCLFCFLCFVYFFFILYLTFFKFFVLYFIFLTPGAFWGLHPLKKLDFCISYEKAVLLMDGQTCQRLKLWRIHLPVFKHLRQD
jgi:hypothetical protein